MMMFPQIVALKKSFNYNNYRVYVLQVFPWQTAPEPDWSGQQQECVHPLYPTREEFWQMPISGNIVDERRNKAPMVPLNCKNNDIEIGI